MIAACVVVMYCLALNWHALHQLITRTQLTNSPATCDLNDDSSIDEFFPIISNISTKYYFRQFILIEHIVRISHDGLHNDSL